MEKLYKRPWILQRADPYVYRHTDGWYYFLATVPAYDRICIRRAHTLQQLPDAPETTLWVRHESGAMSEHIWAPELHRIDGCWYIYFAAGERERPWEIRPYVLCCRDADPVGGKWIECGKMQAAAEDEFSFRAFSLDGTTFACAGKRYFVWAEKVGVGKQISNLYIAEMETPTRLKTAQVLLTSPDYAWERHGFWVNEGPAVLQHNGKIFLTYSASDTSAAYCVGMLCADADTDLLDPRSWHKSPVPVLRTEPGKQVYGPGHNCFVKNDAGEDLMVFHARSYSQLSGNPLNNPDRHACVLPVQWDARDNPLFVIPEI